MKFQVKQVNSTAIRLIAYAPTERILRLLFRSGGAYDYHNIEKQLFNTLINAESVGQSFWEEMKRQGIKHSRKLTEVEIQDFLMSYINSVQEQTVSVETL